MMSTQYNNLVNRVFKMAKAGVNFGNWNMFSAALAGKPSASAVIKHTTRAYFC